MVAGSVAAEVPAFVDKQACRVLAWHVQEATSSNTATIPGLPDIDSKSVPAPVKVRAPTTSTTAKDAVCWTTAARVEYPQARYA